MNIFLNIEFAKSKQKGARMVSGEKILSLLVELLADQHNVKVKYHITTNEEKEGEASVD